MTHDVRVLQVRKKIIPEVEAYEKTITSEKPFGCKQKLEKVVHAYDECKKVFGQMPSANKIGYGHIRDRMNNAMEHYSLKHSY
jgi:hypothetical protein